MQARKPPGIRDRRSESGFALLTTAFGMIGMVAAVGLGVDIGRMYIAKNEAQLFADSAATAAALELDGTTAGLTRARSAVTSNANRYNLQNSAFSNSVTEFSTAIGGPFSANPASATGIRFVRVTATAPVNVYFLRVAGTNNSSTARASAIGAQVDKTYFSEGSFPFSPMAHASNATFGWTIGNQYTIRWPSAPRLNQNVCSGDNINSIVVKSEAGGGAERGFIEETSASNVRAAIVSSYQTRPVYIGGVAQMTGGAKQTIRDALIERINMDTDPNAATFTAYKNNGTGNGRRVVVVPVNDWHPTWIIKGFAAMFLLQTSKYDQGGNKEWCAEYIGPYIQGSKYPGGSSTNAGAYVVRLVQ